MAEETQANGADLEETQVKAAKPKKKKRLQVILGAIIILLAAAGTSYYLYMMRYVSTDDAQISVPEGDSVPITVAFPGRLSTWNVNVNDMVNLGQVIGTESNQSVLSLNPTLLPYIQQDQLLAQRLIEMENVRTPISGKVIQSNVAVGQEVQPGQVLALIENLDRVQVTANILETEIKRVHVGQKVDISVDGLPGQQLHGVVSRIDDVTQSVFSIVPNVTAASGSYTKVMQRIPVMIDIADKNLAQKVLVPGMSAVIKIHVD